MNFIEIPNWKPICFLHTDGRTDMKKQIVTSSNFETTPKPMLHMER